MRFEKINENKLKITLSNDELPISNNLDSFMTDTSDAREAFLNMLDKAEEAVGFNTKDYKIKIQAKALHNGDFVFIVTKLVQMNNKHIVVRPKKILKASSQNSLYTIYRFESFDDFCSFCEFLKSNKINYLKSLSKSCKLYKYSNYFYLCFERINENYRKISMFYSSITEFSKFFSTKDLFASTLKEHGELLIDDNAIITCQSYFKS